MAVLTLYSKVEWLQAGTWADITAQVLRVRAEIQITGDRANALAFGDAAEARCTVVLSDSPYLYASTWDRISLRVTFTVDGLDQVAFVGVIRSRAIASDYTMTFECSGFAELLRTMKTYSPPFTNRPAATKTTSTSVDDPTDPAYAAGLVNYALWQAGGRPYEQAYVTAYAAAARFWYRCDQAPMPIGYAWLAGEDGYAALVQLCQAVGGQLYQASDGVVCYRQPFNVAESSAGPLYTFDEAVYGSAECEASGDLAGSKIVCSFVPREVRPLQEVVHDQTARVVLPGQTLTIELEPKWPLYSLALSAGQIPAGQFNYTRGSLFNDGLTHAVDWLAQRITITISNATSVAATVWEIILHGEPICAGEPGTVTVGSGSTVRALADNPYIQSYDHAERLALMVLAFYAVPRPIWTIKGCPPSADRSVGEIVQFSRARYSISNERMVIISTTRDQSGQSAEYQLVPVGDLPYTSEFFVVGRDYAGVSAKLGY